LRRALGPALGGAFVLQFVALDLAFRGAAGYAHRPATFAGALGSGLLWSLVRDVCAARGVRVGVALLAATLVVFDALVHRYYGTPLDPQVVASALHSWSDVRPVLVRLLPGAATAACALAAIEYGVLCVRTPTIPQRARPWLLVGLAACALAVPLRDATPEFRAASALGPLFGTKEASAAAPAHVPLLPSSRDEIPNVLVIITESVRSSSYCSAPDPSCPFSPEVSALVPNRVPLRQMRSVSSYTAVSVSALFTGRPQEGPRVEIAGAPTLFDYARAVRVGGRAPTVAYWSAQSASVFERELRGSVDMLVTQETLLGHAVEDEDDVVELGLDQRLAELFVRELPQLPKPFLVVLHLIGTHAPYFVDDARAPFQPFGHVASWAGLPELRNAYHDAIVTQDHAVAVCLRAFFDTVKEKPWFVLFTSDHGEAFGEHQAIHHGQNLFDEQTHVPAWVAASPRALTEEQHIRLAEHERAFLTHLDVVPTLLDVLGVYDSLPMANLHAALAGRSLLAPCEPMRAPVPVTNCTQLFPCPLNTWGLLDDDHALLAQPWDGDWNCVDLTTEGEHVDDAACARLRAASRATYQRRPNGEANR
jgi:hypothetical protein